MGRALCLSGGRRVGKAQVRAMASGFGGLARQMGAANLLSVSCVADMHVNVHDWPDLYTLICKHREADS